MITGCEKVIHVWDTSAMTLVATLKGHKDYINCLHMADDLLISAGKGGSS